jgi:hypothetical protein
MRWTTLFVTAIAGSSLVAACNSSSDTNGPADAFAAQYCNLTSKCCTSANEMDPASCAASMREFIALGAQYNQANGDACLAKLSAATGCNFQDAAVCSQVFGFGATGQLRTLVAAGATCDGTQLSGGVITFASGIGSTEPSTLHLCDGTSSSRCDDGTHVCVALVDDGGACTGSSLCKSNYCGSQDKCVGAAPVGGSCTDAPCDATSRCQSGVCVATLASGQPCQPNQDACSGFCDATTMKCVGSSGSPPPLGCFSQGP